MSRRSPSPPLPAAIEPRAALFLSGESASDLLKQRSLTELAEEALRPDPHGPDSHALLDHAPREVLEDEEADRDPPAEPRIHGPEVVENAEQPTTTSDATERAASARPARRDSRWRAISLDELKRAKEQEEARVLLELEIEAEENAELEGRQGDGLKQTEADESAADEPTAFGLPRVEIASATALRRRSSLTSSIKMVAALAVDTVRQKTKQTVAPLGPQMLAIAQAKKNLWIAAQEVFWQLLIVLDAVYVLVSVPLRIGFFYDPWNNRYRKNGGPWSDELSLFSALDLAGELCRWRYTWQIVRKIYAQRKRRPKTTSLTRRLSSINPLLFAKSLTVRPLRGSLFSVESDTTRELRSFDAIQSFKGLSAASKEGTDSTPSLVSLALGIIPFEIVTAFTNNNWLHLVRVGKFVLVWHSLLSSYSGLLLKGRRYSSLQWLSFSTLATPFYLFWLGLYLCHLSACGYMLIANIECGLQSQHCIKTPVPGSWVLKDNMERAGLWRRYIRTMYWASKTVTTLGQGDLVPTTLAETNYCVIVQFISGLWATAFLASCTFYFSRIDRNIENGVSTRLEQALRFLRSRKVPSSLSKQIRNYYQHIQRTRNGVEEEQVLANLPDHYQFQCAFFVKYRLVAKVPFFSKQPKAFLRTVVNALDNDFLSPKDVVLAMYDIEELIIVSYGNIAVLNQQKEVVRLLSEEEWFAEDALFDDVRSEYELEAKTFCEIFRLSRPVFVACMEKHFAKLRIAALMAKQKKRPTIALPRGVQTIAAAMIVTKPRSTRSSLLKRLSQRGEFDSMPWQHPNSHFRKQWRRWKVFFLLFLAGEVPYEIAFKWRRGFFGHDVTFSQQSVYLMSFATEIFFYVDWYFRAFRFARRSFNEDTETKTLQQRENTEQSLHTSVTSKVARKRDDLVTSPHALFQNYLSSDDVIFDVISIVPISMIWNFVNRSTYSIVLREIMRCARLLALTRLLALKPLMKKIMVEFDFSPASHLLTNVIVFCIIAANGMACYFYLLADDKDLFDALPLDFDDFSASITSQSCLEQATLFGNCTWFMYDRSTFKVQARYIRSLHWSLVLLSTVGYGDIVSFTNSECLIGFWWIYLGALICYFTSCAVGSVVSQVTVLRTAKANRVEEITRALVRSEISSSTRLMIRSFYEANWELNGGVIQEECLMKRLPLSLRHQLSSSLYLQPLRKCYVFAGFGGQLHMIREIALAMSSTVVLPGFPIVESGHLGDALYLVLSGEVEVLLPLRYRGGSIMTAKRLGFLKKRHTRGFLPAMLHRMSRVVFPRRSDLDLSASAEDLLAALGNSMIRPRGLDRYRLRDVPMAVLKEGDSFGDEGLLPHDRYALSVTVRALTSAQIGILHRDAFLSLSDRYPAQLGQMIALIMKRYQDNQALYTTIRTNLENRDKVREFLGNSRSAHAERKKLVDDIGMITPDRAFYRIWRVVHGVLVLFNFYQITFRLAFLPYPTRSTMLALCAVDYLIDAFFIIDIYLKWNRFGFEKYGDNVTNTFEIRRRYKKGWFRMDCLSMLPLYYYGDYFGMTLVRLPRLLKCPQLLENINEIESMIRERFMKGSTTMLSVFDLLKFLAFFLSAAHHVGSIYFLLGRILTTYGLSSSSWMTVDPIINANPGNVMVQYNRAIYWCLETFTVVCFGDVLARNAVETVYASATCIIGWMCIGQVVGRITSLMASIDMDLKEYNTRVDKFEQYARNRRLPQFLRERAIESVEYKSKCLIELKMRSIFDDLPLALHVILFEELHGDLLRGVPELMEMCSNAQIRVLANAFELEIYVADDIIIEEGRLGSKLFIMKEGRAEFFSIVSKMVFAGVHEGVLFGDLAFFLTGTRQIASVRASRSCQVLQLSRSKWNELWSDNTRFSLESKILPTMRRKYESVSLAFLNIIKNLHLSIHTTMKPNPTSPLEFGASTRSLQSSGASCGGASSGHSSGYSNSSGNIADVPADQSSRSMSNVFGAALGLKPASSRVMLGDVPPLRTALSRKRRKSKKSVPSGGQQRKLSVVLGIDTRLLHGGGTEQYDSADQQWKRHEKNLRVLRFIDSRMQQDRSAIQPRVTHAGNMDTHDPTTDFDAVGLSSPSKVTNRRLSTDARNVVDGQAATPVNGASNSAAQVNLGMREWGIGKRHSIQMDREDLKQAFQGAVNDDAQHATKHQATAMDAAHTMQVTNATPAHNGRVEASRTQSSALSRAVASAVQTLSKKNVRDVAGGPSVRSAPSSTASSGSDGRVEQPEQTSYAQHLENLKMRSIRRQRRSVFASIKEAVGQVDETKNPYEIWFEPPLPPAFCLETSSFRRAWSSIMYFICLYYIMVVPFRVSFDFEYLSSPETNTMTTVWFALEYVMDLLCVVDFFLHRNFFTFVHSGTLITDKQSIRKHYFREGTFVVDLICILPLELLIPLAPFLSSSPGTTSKVTWYRIAVFRLNKMVRIAHLHSLGDKIQRMLIYDFTSLASYLRPSVIYFVRFAFDFALGAHWVACFFYGFAFNTFVEGVPSWLSVAGMLTFEGLTTEQDIGRVSVLMKYARSYHYSMGAITTVSYGDIAPQNAWETFAVTFIIVISIVLFGMLSGGFSQVFEMELGQRADYEEKIASVAHFMMFHRFPSRIWNHMQSYFMIHWKESQGMNEDELLSGLPLSVKNDIMLFVKQDFVKQLRLFAGCDEAFVRAVVVAFDQELFIRNDVIVSYGERGRRCLYVIETGHVLVRVPKKITNTTVQNAVAAAPAIANIAAAMQSPQPTGLQQGASPKRGSGRMTFSQGADIEITKGRFDFFGEKSLIFDVPRSATCIALSSCSMLILTLAKYEEILSEFPEYREKNMHDWIFANARENTPASAIRTPSKITMMKNKKSMRSQALAVAGQSSPAAPAVSAPLPPPRPPTTGPSLP